MSKWTRTRRDPGRTYIDEEAQKFNAKMVERMKWFLAEGSADDEPAYVQAVKDAMPNVSKEELKEFVKQFRDVISARQRRDQGLR
jgi:hypothetical protein